METWPSPCRTTYGQLTIARARRCAALAISDATQPDEPYVIPDVHRTTAVGSPRAIACPYVDEIPGEAPCNVVSRLVGSPTNLPCHINLISPGAPEVINRRQRCEECVDDVHEPAFFCEECNAFICEIVKDAHKAVRSLARHVIVPIESLPEVGVSTSTVAANGCSEHNNSPFVAFDKQCGKLVCGVCIVRGSHKGHDVRDLGEVCAESRQQVAGLVEQAEACFARLCASNNEFSSDRSGLDASLATSIDRIKAVMEEVWSRLLF